MELHFGHMISVTPAVTRVFCKAEIGKMGLHHGL
jgi:hypothetical protein